VEPPAAEVDRRERARDEARAVFVSRAQVPQPLRSDALEHGLAVGSGEAVQALQREADVLGDEEVRAWEGGTDDGTGGVSRRSARERRQGET